MARYLSVFLALLLLALVCHVTEGSQITPQAWDKAYKSYSDERTKCESNNACIYQVNKKYLPQAKRAIESNLLALSEECKNGEAQAEIQYEGGTIEGPAPCSK